MNTRRSFLEGAGGALLLSFVPWSPAYGAQVVDVRAWPAEEYTRITIEHDAPMKFKYFVLRNSDPVRLAVDIDGVLLTDKLKQIIQKVKPNDPYISRIRVGQNRPNVVRISIDFKTDVDPQVFSLKPAGQYRYRLVFDIYPATQKDPLMAIIQKEESEPDAIKSLLAQVAEGQKRMEENRADSGEVDQLGQILAGIADGSLAPMRPDEEPKGSSKPAQKKPAQKKPETQLAQTKPSKTKPARSPRVRTLVITRDTAERIRALSEEDIEQEKKTWCWLSPVSCARNSTRLKALKRSSPETETISFRCREEFKKRVRQKQTSLFQFTLTLGSSRPQEDRPFTS